MERKPSFVIRHGISIVFFLLVLFLAMTNFIPYTDSINVNAIIIPNCHEIWCQAQEDGEIIYLFDELEKKVRSMLCLFGEEIVAFQSRYTASANEDILHRP